MGTLVFLGTSGSRAVAAVTAGNDPWEGHTSSGGDVAAPRTIPTSCRPTVPTRPLRPADRREMKVALPWWRGRPPTVLAAVLGLVVPDTFRRRSSTAVFFFFFFFFFSRGRMVSSRSTPVSPFRARGPCAPIGSGERLVAVAIAMLLVGIALVGEWLILTAAVRPHGHSCGVARESERTRGGGDRPDLGAW